MDFIKTSDVLKDVKIFKGKFFPDERGYFKKPFFGDNLESDFQNISEVLVSKSRKNVIRGIHFQTPPWDVSKLVSCIDGVVKDVFIDLRKDSPTYGAFDYVYLDNVDNFSVIIPKGFGHGFSVLSESATVVYLQSGPFNDKHDSGINSLDLEIDWEVEDPILSEKDKSLISFSKFQSPW